MSPSTAPNPVKQPVIPAEIERYLDVSAKVVSDDLDWNLARKVGLTPEEVFMLTYFCDIEWQTIFYFRDLLKTRASKEGDVLAFLTIWNYEEFYHGQLLAQMLRECGYPLEESRVTKIRASSSLSEALEAFGAAILSKIFAAEFPAVHASWGAVQELTAVHGYEELAKTTKNPVLKTICERIVKQERRHYAWYFNNARERLTKSPRARWLTRALLSRFWSPNGAGVKTELEVARLMSFLFLGPIMESVSKTVDAKIGTLPGMEGISLMRTYLEKAKRILASPDVEPFTPSLVESNR